MTTDQPRSGTPATRPAFLPLVGLAHLLVLAAWAVTGASVMGSLGVARRMAINSEWALDTGRLPQPWVIPIGIVAIVVAHLLFRWSMVRYRPGDPAYGPSVVAWCGLLLGVAYGAYLWPGPVVVGRKEGPTSGHSTPWDIVGWIAYHARLWLPGVIALITLGLLLFSEHSPWRAGLRAYQRAWAERVRRRAQVA